MQVDEMRGGQMQTEKKGWAGGREGGGDDRSKVRGYVALRSRRQGGNEVSQIRFDIHKLRRLYTQNVYHCVRWN